jgi:hypothetical protein
MNLDVAISKLSLTDKNLMKSVEAFIKANIALQLVAGVKLRIQKTGVNSNGTLFPNYSTRPLLIGYSEYPINKKIFQKKAKDPKTIWATSIQGFKGIVLVGGYKEARQLTGYQTAHKDFMVTGAMWRGVKMKSVTTKGTKIEITYGSTDNETDKKLQGHNKREKINIILPTKKELDEVAQDIASYLETYIKMAING